MSTSFQDVVAKALRYRDELEKKKKELEELLTTVQQEHATAQAKLVEDFEREKGQLNHAQVEKLQKKQADLNEFQKKKADLVKLHEIECREKESTLKLHFHEKQQELDQSMEKKMHFASEPDEEARPSSGAEDEHPQTFDDADSEAESLDKQQPVDGTLYNQSHSLEHQAGRFRNKKTSKYRGVSINGSKWVAQLSCGKTKQYLGIFQTEEEAARAFDRAARKTRGPNATLNFPDLESS